MNRCQGNTLSNKRCQNKSIKGSKFCHIHQNVIKQHGGSMDQLVDLILRFCSIFKDTKHNVVEMRLQNDDLDIFYLHDKKMDNRTLLRDILTGNKYVDFSIAVADRPMVAGYVAKMHVIHLEKTMPDIIKIIIMLDTESTTDATDYIESLGPNVKFHEGKTIVEFDWGTIFA